MIIPDATLQLAVIMVICFLSQKTHYAIATASSIVNIDERTNLDPAGVSNRKDSILSTDRTKFLSSKLLDTMLESFEVKTTKKKKVIYPTPKPTPMPTKVVTLKPTVQMQKKGPTTKSEVITKPTITPSKAIAKNVPSIATPIVDVAPKKGNVPDNKNDLPGSTGNLPDDKTGTVTGNKDGGSNGKNKINGPSVGDSQPEGDESGSKAVDDGKDTSVPESNGDDKDTNKGGGKTEPPAGSASDGVDDAKDGTSSNDETGSGEKDKDPDKDEGKTEPPAGSASDGVDDAKDGTSSNDETGSGEKDKDPDKGEGKTEPPAGIASDGGDKAKSKKPAIPTYQPTSSFKSPTVLLDVETMKPIAKAPPAASKGQRNEKLAKPSFKPSPKPSAKRSPLPSPPSASSVISGSEPVDETLVASEKSALTSAKYFFYTFMACVAVLGVVYCIRSRCRGGHSADTRQQKYSMVNTSDPTEEEDGGFFSNRNLEMARRP